jgi:hypothetical protein
MVWHIALAFDLSGDFIEGISGHGQDQQSFAFSG